jgi:hypothetical protein
MTDQESSSTKTQQAARRNPQSATLALPTGVERSLRWAAASSCRVMAMCTSYRRSTLSSGGCTSSEGDWLLSSSGAYCMLWCGGGGGGGAAPQKNN